MSAAVILCAGKGTRMNDNSINKVCFPCAGVPVIRRIISNLRSGGVDTFVVVVGHNAQSVKDVLAGETNILYAYQQEQKGTGHAALCGLEALKAAGYHGRAIVTMGDKIISAQVIKELLECDQRKKAVWGVQPLANNYSGGRVVVADGKAYGVVEFADAALMAIAQVPQEQRAKVLQELRLNEKKAAKVLEKAKAENLPARKVLCGRTFTPEEILNTPFANAGLYCFDVDAAIEAIGKCDTTNAQGEIYLTDTLAMFAQEDEAVLYEVKSKEDMRTFSTKPELNEMSRSFYHKASSFAQAIDNGSMDDAFAKFYSEPEEQKKRCRNLITKFTEKYGDKKIVITRAPGRVNLMGRHVDHRGGSVNDMTINCDVVLVVSPRSDEQVNISFTDGLYPDSTFSISQCLALAPHEQWLDYLEADAVKAALKSSSGSAINYVKAAVLRFQLESNIPLCGMDILLDGSIPMAVGLSSSSAIVVATAEAVCFLNNLNLNSCEFVELCGEGEWFVGSRGGAADHAAMKCCSRGHITHLSFKPFAIGETVPFSDRYAIMVANSMQKAKKSEGCKDKFNAQVAASDIALLLLKKRYPEYAFKEFRDITRVPELSKIYEMILALPCEMTRQQARTELAMYQTELERIFANHAEPEAYDVRGVALYGISECMRAEKCLDAMTNEDYELLGSMMKISHQGDSVTNVMPVDDATIRRLADEQMPLYMVAGAYGCSTERIDGLCDLLNSYDGVLGSALVGAGLGGCILALVEKDKANMVMENIKEDFYRKNGLEESVYVYFPSSGSGVIY